VLKRIRNSNKYKLPVIMLTAKNEEIDAILGLEMGADDYIGKPFRSRELISRLKAVIRRFNMDDSNVKNRDFYAEGSLEISTETHQVFLNGREIEMTLKEFGLLEKLISSPGRVFTREELLESVWGYDYVGETRTVDVHIRQLRKKLEEDDTVPKMIITVRGIGYKFKSSKGS
jgi:two-component system alkaline phosphatase synthesis response regulator PhoP